MAGKGIEFRATGEQGGSRARGVEADAHRVPTVNVDYTRVLNLCACICERTLDLAFPKERIEKSVRESRGSSNSPKYIYNRDAAICFSLFLVRSACISRKRVLKVAAHGINKRNDETV